MNKMRSFFAAAALAASISAPAMAVPLPTDGSWQFFPGPARP